jgi:hypothetical protein
MSDHPTAPLLQGDAWLREESPEVYHLVRAVAGDAESQRWLEARGQALGLFARAAAGDRSALAVFRDGGPDDLDDLCGALATFDRSSWLSEHNPDLHLLVEAVKGDDDSLRRLKRKRAALSRLAEAVRGPYADRCADDPPAAPVAPTSAAPDGAADVGCLVGEMHLRQGDYTRAVEAFSRAIEGRPTADAYQGRARAYHALAQDDERRARELGGEA